MMKSALAAFAAVVAILPAAAQRSSAPIPLHATPQTVAWGYYDAASKPALRIQSGDTVVVDTLITSSPQRLEAAGIPPAQVEQSLRDIYQDVTNRGPGGHILTGPIYVEGAEPGDALEVRVLKIDLAIPYAYNGFGPRRGFLPEDFPTAKTKIVQLDGKRMVGKFSEHIEIPLHPFFGSMGVAPPAGLGRTDSAPPSLHAGNMDNKELVAGTTVFFPVWTPGALFVVGDGHAAMGNGEVDITALETSLRGTLQFILHKGAGLKYPRAETPAYYISMGFSEDLTEAAKIAVREMIDFLVREKNMARDDAYMLTSSAGDVDVTELVDGNKGVHVMMPKAVFLK